MRHLLLLLLILGGYAADDRRPLVRSPTGTPTEFPNGDTLRVAPRQGLDAAKGAAASYTKCLYIATDTNILYFSDGVSWVSFGESGAFSDSEFSVYDEGDATKIMVFSLGAQTASTTLTINTGAQNANRVLSVPPLVGNDTIATLGVQNTFTDTTDSTSKDTGSIVTEGGIGAEKSILAGGGITSYGHLEGGFATVNGRVAVRALNGTSPQFAIGNNAGDNHWLIYETLIAAAQNTFGIYDAVGGANRLTIAPTTGTVGIPNSTASTSPITGSLIVGDTVTAATNVGIGGGNVVAGSTVQALLESYVGPSASLPSSGALRVGGVDANFFEAWRVINNSGSSPSLYALLGGATSGSVPQWQNSAVLETSFASSFLLSNPAASGSVRFTVGTGRPVCAIVNPPTTATTPIVGTMIVGDGATSASNVSMGGGNVVAGGTVTGVGGGKFGPGLGTASALTGSWPVSGSWIYLQNDQRPVAIGDYALIQGSDGTTWVNASAGGQVGLRVNNDDQLVADGQAISATVPFYTVAATTARTSLNIPHGAAPTTPTNGDVWTTTAGVFARINGATVGPLGSGGGGGFKFSSRNSVNVSNTTTESTLISGTNTGSLVFGGGALTEGSIIRVRFDGTVRTNSGSTPNLTIRLKLGSAVIAGTGTAAMTDTASFDERISGTLYCVVRTTGASGVIYGTGDASYCAAGAVFGTTKRNVAFPDTNPTIDTTASNTLDFTAQWGTTNSNNSMIVNQFTVEHILP